MNATNQGVKTLLGEHIKTQKGFAFKSKWYSECGTPIVKVSEFTDNSIDTSNLTCIPDDIAASYVKYKLQNGDTIIQTVGSWPRNPKSVVGKVIKVPSKASGALLNQNAVKIYPAKTLDRSFIFYLLKCNIFKDFIISCAQGAANQASITLDDIRNFSFLLPSLPTQRKIAAILSAYDDLIENNTRRIKILEEMAQALYHEWFVEFRFPVHENVKMVDSELGMVPEGWKVRQIQDVCSKINSGGTPARQKDTYWRNGEVDWFKTKELQDGFLFSSEEKISKDGLENSSAKILPKNTIVMAIYAAPTVGRLGILTHPSCFNQAAVGLVANPEVSSSRFLYYKLFEMRDYFNLISHGAAQQNINVQKVKEAKILLPTINLINNFDTFVAPVLYENKNLTMKNAYLRRTRDLLLPKLISGELDVENIEVQMPNGVENEQ